MQTTDVKGYHLSLQQARLWALQGKGQAYSTQCAVWLKGKLDLSALLDALQSLVRRYEILQTGFQCLPGMELPVQVVTSNVEVCCRVIDLENLSASGQIAYLDEYLTSLRQKTPDLAARSLLVAGLLRFSIDRHLLVMHLPALCADGYTLMRMVWELGQTYVSVLKGVDQDEEALQYADIAAWQDQLLELEEAEALRTYWHKIDLSQLATLGLPFERKEATKGHHLAGWQKETFAPCVFEISLEESVSAQISHLAQRYSVSPEAWLLACWEAVLWRLNGKQDLLIGVACNGRTYEGLTEELAKALGLYTRFVPVGAILHENLPFDQIVTSVNKSLLEAMKWQIYFTWKEEAENGAIPGDSPLLFFPICFEYEYWPASFDAGELSFSLHRRFCCTEPFALKLSVLQVGERLQLELHFDPQKISLAQVRWLAAVLRTLLREAIAQPQAQVSRLPLLEPDEQVSLLTMGCAPTKPLLPRGLHQLFEEQAQRQPNQLAVISPQEQLTYQQLNERANRLAQVLRRRGIGPNVLVGLCLARGTQMLVGLLGILKAGGAYMPLEPEIPPARLTYQLQESQAALLLTQREVNTHLLEWGGKTLCLEDLEQEISQVPAGDLPGESKAEDLAYVIYTSGSTGVPKGVMIRQSSVVNYALALCELLEAEPGWQYATVSTLAADLGNTAIFCALASGGCVQVLDYETVTSVEEMARWMEQHPIDVLKIVPSHLSALLTGERAKELVPRQALVLGGEALPVSLLERLQELGGSCQIYNHYGPTETTIGVLVNPLGIMGATEDKIDKTSITVSLGNPITNTEVYILDRWMHMVPEEVTGELYVGGSGLAMGYLGQPEQTAERFVPHPWSRQAGARLYRTGDLACYREHGKIEFVGRRDRQVKLRGYRIELAEIQAVLGQHPQIRSSVVVLREDVPAEPRLVSYVVARQRLSLPSEQLREFLRQSLPEYMVPAIYVQVDALPLTANGKVDWQNLPVPEQRSHKEEAITAGPRSPIEEMLVQMWRDLLGVPELGIHDQFFLVGGHSLLATRVMAQIQAILQITLPVQLLFEAPTVAALAQRVEQALRKSEGVEVPPLVAIERPEEIPLSFAQQRLWFLDQLEPGGTAYLVPRAGLFLGDLNVQALEQTLQELIRRHESLRTTFEIRITQPVQVIRPASRYVLPVIDLQGLRQEQREQEVRKLVGQEAQHPCDLARGPLLRTYVLRLQRQEHVLLLTLHHIITDGWSNSVLMRELNILYRSNVSGQPCPLAPLPIQYADYALWQRQCLQGEVLEAQLAYWRKQLANVVPLEFPTDHPRPTAQTSRGASQSRQLPLALYEELIALSRRQDITLFMLLLATFQVLLMRYTSQTDISVGTLIANRTLAEVESMIGLLINPLVMRIDLSDNPPFQQVLQRVRKICLEAYTHQDVPFERLLEDLQPERDLSRPPLFQVLFQLQQLNASSQSIPELKLEPLEHHRAQANYDLEFVMVETQQGLHCLAIYNTDLFEADTITRMLGHWQTLLEGVLQTPQARLSDLPLLSVGEREQLLVEWNATKTDYPQELCLPQVFEHQVQQTPDAIALVCEQAALTYEHLNARSNQLAYHLQRLGVGPEVLIGVCMERSCDLLIALLAILKAGGVYVPLDPTYPRERLSWILKESQPAVVLIQASVRSRLDSAHSQLLCVDADGQRWKHEPRTNPASQVTAEQLAYVIYTSGSTGVPKGAMVLECGMVNHLFAKIAQLHLDGQDRIAQTASLGFDISLWQLLAALLVGGTTIIYGSDLISQPVQLVQRLQEDQISIFETVPSLLRVILESMATWPKEQWSLPALRWLIATGEALPADLCRTWFDFYPSIALLNAYGPTECSDDVTHYVLREAPASRVRSVPIGQPVNNLRMYVLNSRLMLVPVGTVGELYVGGVGVGRGYLNDPQRTAEAFVPDPFAVEAGMRLYKTGDLVCYQLDGTIEFVGRVDQQVKIRGFRIELGEIEATLMALPAVREAVVLVQEDEAADKRLVAYVVPQQGQRLTSSDMRSYLQHRLPAYLIPSDWVPLEALPLTPNGKVDRRALPVSKHVEDGGDGVQGGARMPIEDLLVGLWSKVLGRKQVGTHEHFFELGGHSLLATRLIAKVRTMLQVEMPLRAVFEAPTVATFAQRVEEALRKSEGMHVPPLVATERSEEAPLSFAQQRLWFLDQLEPGSAAYLIAHALRFQGDLSIEALERSLEELVHRHESLRTTFRMQAGQPVQVIHPAGAWILPVIDLQRLRQEHRGKVAQWVAKQEAQHPYDLAKGPLLRTYLLQLETQEYVVLLTLHHSITDEWSNQVLVRELTMLYHSFVAGQPSPLAPLPIQYADYALWQREWLQGEVLETQLAYWKKQLAGISPLALLSDHPRPPIQTHRGGAQSLQLSAVLSEELMTLSRQQDVTLFMLLLTAFQILLMRYTGQTDMSVGTPIANRRQAELEGIIGFFVNTLVMRADLSGNPTFEQMLQRVRKICLEAYAHQDIPFEKVVEELEPERDLSRSPLFQVMFVHHFGAGEQEELSAVSVEPLVVESTISKFDLTLSIWEIGQGLHCSLEYNTDLFEANTITRMLGHWQILLEGIVHNPQAHVSDVPLLTEGEREQLLVQWNATQSDYPRDLCVHRLFEQQAAQLPNQLAVICSQEQLTYRQLNEQANRLAQVLQQRGVGVNVLVGLCLTRSVQMLVGLLAILKAGGAYMPLDPESPPTRFIYQLRESQASLLLTQREVSNCLSEWGGRTLYLEELEQEMSQAPASDLSGGNEARDLAYVIYTSGSTGVPKGVMVRQGSVVNYTLALCELLGAEPGWQYATVSTLAADLGNTAIFCALASGGCVQVLDYETVTSVEEMAKWGERHPIDVLKIVPSHLSALLTSERAKEVVPRRALVLGGEALPMALLERLQELGGTCQVYNHYGPTETTIGVLVNGLGRLDELDKEAKAHLGEQTEKILSLGKPIANSEVYVLDDRMQLVPIGITGELYIGGAGLAMGYVQQPEQTAERFMPHPYNKQAGACLYRTGDLARYGEGGKIEFVGRYDSQVKLRGYRIELGEIEAGLRRHHQVWDCSVLLQDAGPGAPQLIGYVVARMASQLTAEALREFLKKYVPEYMVPSSFVMLEALPLTPNGKVDRQRLPKPEQFQKSELVVQREPWSSIEEVLMEMWKELLAVPGLGIHDNFFAAGGHSLLVTRLIAQVRAVLQVELPVRAVFEAPTVATFAQRVEEALRKSEGMHVPPLVATERSEEAPLSFAQQRLWFLDQLEPGSAAYLIAHALRFQGDLSIEALERSLQELVHRHESLRTTFRMQADQPVQVIHPAGAWILPVIDLQRLRQEHRGKVAQWVAKQEAQYPCDLAKGPLLRTYLLQLEIQEYVVLLTLHHSITDEWSNQVLVRELTMLYHSFVAGQPSPLAPLPIQYADYALWQREWLQGEVLETQLAYWKKQLAGISPLALLSDHPRPPIQTHRGGAQSLQLSAVLSEELMALSRQQDVTLFMLLLTAFQILLMRYTGQTDMSVGTPIANRRQAELEGIIGFFVNTLVMRADLSGNPTFEQMLQRVRKICLEAYAHQDIPFEKVVEELEPERDLSRSPLFQVMFVLQNGVGEQEELPGVSVKPLAVESITSKFDLTLVVTQTGQHLHCALEYTTDLFEPDTITRMFGHWQTLLEGIEHNPQAHVSDVPLLTEDEREQLLVQWNTTQVDYSQDRCVHQLFEQQVERTPDAVALVFEDEALTYQELNQGANQLAHYLQDLGVGPEVLVGICMERCIEMVVGLLGVLKAGGAYVPLDPSYPKERLAFMVRDAHLAVLLTQQQLQKQMPLAEAQVIVLEQVWERLVCEPNENPMSTVSPENLAYVIYTSGSTGVPKGVLVPHANVHRLFTMTQAWFQFQAQDIWTQFHSCAFDFSVWEIWGALLHGGRLVVVPSWASRSPDLFSRLLIDQQVTVLNQTPSAFRLLMQVKEVNQTPEDLALRLVIFGGEALDLGSLQPWVKRHGDQRPHLINMYGITETTVHVTSRLLSQTDLIGGTGSVIGRAIPDLQLYILDKHQRLVPIGVSGELYVGGLGLARGYWHRPELTAERFVPHPWSQEPGVRLYRTGDLVRYRSDGDIEYLGRVDQQVKIRGYRIELGEIEVVLREHPAIEESVVLVREDVAGEKRLVAYPVVQQGQGLTSRDLRTYLQDRLPVYMIPSAFVLLDALPLTPNGKVDRRALPEPEEVQYGEHAGQGQALTPIEELLVGLWSEVLGRRQVGIDEHFFELGGHSLLATRLIARVREVLQVEVPLRAIFERPTVATFAQRVQEALGKDEVIRVPPLVAGERPQEIPLSFAQQRLWFLDQLEPGSTVYLIPSAQWLQGDLNLQALQQSLQELMAQHESLRTTFEMAEQGPVQVIHPVGSSFVPIIDLTGLSQEHREQEAQSLARQEAERPCELTRGPLLRIHVVRLQTQEHVLLLTLHHIITDGWSNSVLVRELSTLYQAFLIGQSSPLAPLPIQYADYALWQRGWLQGEALEGQLAYWRKQLAGVSPLALPTDHPRPAIQTHRGALQSLQVSEAVSQAVMRLCRQQDVTLFMLLLAAWQVLLLRYTGQGDISVGTPIANRSHMELEEVIGLFVNTLVMRTDLSGNPTFVEVLTKVRHVCLGAYAHQDIPFEKVVEELEPERDLSRSPLFQVMFVLQNGAGEQGELPGVSVKPLAVESTISKFDLTLSIGEIGQGLHCSLEYNTDLFEANTITRMLGHWQTLLEGILQTPQARLSDLAWLTQGEREQLLVQWNATQSDSPQDLCVHQLFEQQVEWTPEAVALVFEDQSLTYAQLNRRANQLAHLLRQTALVGPDMLVGLFLERSIELVVALFAILKAGGAYIPLDLTLPQARLATLLQEAQVVCLLTLNQHCSKLPDLESTPTLCLDTLWEQRETCPTSNLTRLLTPSHLAYVIYTSGSTGSPKGAMNTHQGLANHLLWRQTTFPLSIHDRLVQKTPYSFDISLDELFWPLIAGARLVLARPEEHRDSHALVSLLRQESITTLDLVPSQLQMLLAEPMWMELSALRQVFCGGETLSLPLQEQFFACSSAQLYNTYGPSEAAVDASSWHCQAESGETVVPIGTPIRQVQIYVLDASLQLVPVGVKGEIYIAGAGLARGYLHRPELTAERFLPHPWSRQPGARLYRTGDVARYRGDESIESIEFLGRLDQQVKLRGFRIELGEIEACIRQQPSIQDAVVQLQKGSAEGSEEHTYLLAYVQTQAGTTQAMKALQDHLRSQLPSYMVPTFIIPLPLFPLTANGKVDYRALPLPDVRTMQEYQTSIAPCTPIEELLIQIWQELLMQTNISSEDNFFALGGHSLLATQLIARVRTLFQVEVPLRDLFEAPTITQLAQCIERVSKQDSFLLPPLLPQDRPAELPLSYAQERLWFLDQLQPGGTAYLVPCAHHLGGPLNPEALERSLEEMIHRHESLRTTFAAHRGQPVQMIHPVGRHCLSLVDLCGLEQEQREREAQKLAKQEAQCPCDLERGPLLRTSLLQLDDEEHVLLMTWHHIITDGWSNQILVRELITLYRAFVVGQPSPLAPLPIQYADYALWQREWLQGEVLEAQLDYWTRQLGGVPSIELPMDYPRPSVPSSHGAVLHFALTEDLSQALGALSRQENVTLFMTLLAAFQVLFYRTTGQLDIVIGTDSANRNRVEVEGIIGFFVNLLALRTDLSGKPTFREVLKRVREVVLGAYTHEDTPFELLVEKLAPDHYLDRMPLVQALFVLQNIFLELERGVDTGPQVERETVSRSPLHPIMDDETMVKFDLALFMWEQAGRLSGALNYRLDLFKASTIATMTTRFETLLQSIVKQPDTPIDLLEMTSDTERAHQEWEEQELRHELRISNNGWFDLSEIDFAESSSNE